MRYDEFNKRVKGHLSNYKVGVLGISENGVGKEDELKYLLPDKWDENFISNSHELLDDYYDKDRFTSDGKYLNSSKVMIMNFFLPILKNEEILCRFLEKSLGFEEGFLKDIVKVEFAYKSIRDDFELVDLYIEYGDGIKLYIDSKYSEEDFGQFSTEERTRAWEINYRSLAENSMYFDNMGKDDFYRNYKVNRNIAMLKNNKEYSIFIYPFDNGSLYEKIEDIEYDNVKKLDWNIITYDILKMTKNTDLEEYYKEFSRKYLNY